MLLVIMSKRQLSSKGNGLMNAGRTKHDALVKFFCILEELESSRDLIRSGLGHLQEIDMGNAFYHLPHQLMASGLERFMKCYVFLMHEGRHGYISGQRVCQAPWP